ncbi:hypothetical protein OAT16_09870 [Prolixibacteraceae bacterium]|nr:hypothetical protein [Prolixibacteraceae bacterium]
MKEFKIERTVRKISYIDRIVFYAFLILYLNSLSAAFECYGQGKPFVLILWCGLIIISAFLHKTVYKILLKYKKPEKNVYLFHIGEDSFSVDFDDQRTAFNYDDISKFKWYADLRKISITRDTHRNNYNFYIKLKLKDGTNYLLAIDDDRGWLSKDVKEKFHSMATFLNSQIKNKNLAAIVHGKNDLFF